MTATHRSLTSTAGRRFDPVVCRNAVRSGLAAKSSARTYARPTVVPRLAKPAAANTKPSIDFDVQVFLNTAGVGRCVEKYAKGETVFLQGDAADAVFYIHEGSVQITIISPQGKEGVISVLGAGQFFGEGCLAGQTSNISTAAATAKSVIVRITQSTMAHTLRDQPTLAQMFTAFLLSRNIQFEADLVDHLFNSSEKRLARVLLLLANVGKEGKIETIPRINQEILASRVGTTRSRINFFMNKFRKLGFIEYDSGTLKIHSSLMNVIVHD